MISLSRFHLIYMTIDLVFVACTCTSSMQKQIAETASVAI